MDNSEISEALNALAKAVAQLQARMEASEAMADAMVACIGLNLPTHLPTLREQLLSRTEYAQKMDHHQAPMFQAQIAAHLAGIDALIRAQSM